MPIEPIDLRSFKPVPHKIKATSHQIQVGRLPFIEGELVCKTIGLSHRRAWFEKFNQELYRLVIARQPQTYIAKNKFTYYVLSQYISNFEMMENWQGNEPADEDQYAQDLGEILLTAIFFHEIDLNLGNIGKNKQGRLFKCDGNWSTAALLEPLLYEERLTAITPTLIENLPLITEYYVYNWLDIVQKKHNFDCSSIITQSVASSPYFKLGVHQAALRLLLITPAYMKQFIDLYLPENCTFTSVDKLLKSFISRQNELKTCMMPIGDFQTYLQTSDAINNAEQYSEHLKAFSTGQSYRVISSNQCDNFTQDYRQQVLAVLGHKMREPSPTSVIDFDVSSNFFGNSAKIKVQVVQDEQEQDDGLIHIPRTHRKWGSLV